MTRAGRVRGWVVTALVLSALAGCTAILGADKSYHEVGAGGAGGDAGTGATASTSGSSSSSTGSSSSGIGACAGMPGGTPCGAPACDPTGSVISTPTCTDGGLCLPEATSCFPYACSQGTCVTACNVPSDCAEGYQCQASGNTRTCVCNPMQCGEACTGSGPNQCKNPGQASCLGGICCAGSCKTSGAAACAATACASGTGECLYPGSSTPCNGGPLCTGGTFQPNVCDGAGECASPAPCPGGYLCGSATMCATACGATAGAAGCQHDYFCDGNGAGACHPTGANGSACSAGYQCTSGICTSGTCAPIPVGAACTEGAQCASDTCLGTCCAGACASDGTLCGGSCAAGTGVCGYPAKNTSCAGGLSCLDGQLHPDVCTGLGACDSAGTACTGGYLCATATTCATSCGATAGLVGCQSGYYCNGTNGGTCHAQLANGVACTQDYQCSFGICSSGSCI